MVYKFRAGSPEVTELSDFLEKLEQMALELPFIKSTIADVLNTECGVHQLTACRELHSTTNADLDVKYTLDEVVVMSCLPVFLSSGASAKCFHLFLFQFQQKQATDLLNFLATAQQPVKDLDRVSWLYIGSILADANYARVMRTCVHYEVVVVYVTTYHA